MLESRLESYDDVVHDAHGEAPEDHLAINLRAALLKAREYYNKLDETPAHYAATILQPRFKYYCDLAWAYHSDWLLPNNRNYRALWAKYRGLPKLRLHTRKKPKSNNINDAIDSFIDASHKTSNDDEEDDFEIWKRCELQVDEGSHYAKNPICHGSGLVRTTL